jgi:hypothetical protein
VYKPSPCLRQVVGELEAAGGLRHGLPRLNDQSKGRALDGRGEGGHAEARAGLDVAGQVEMKAMFESGSSCFSVERLIPGAFNLGLIGSICTALP